MDNSTADQQQNNHQYRTEMFKTYENKRKRRCSLTQSTDESSKKKTAATICENLVQITNGSSDEQKINPDAFPIFDNESEVQEEFMLETFCDEVLYEIFKFLDTWSLMALMNVCKRFQKFVLDKRLWERIDLSQEPLPLGILEDMLERSHDKTKSIKLRGPSPSQHIEGEIKHFNKTILNTLTTRCTKLITLELYGVTLDFNQISLKDFPQLLKRLVLNNCNVRVDNNKSLFTGIDTILVNLEELAIECNSWFDPYYVMPISKLPKLRYLSLKGCRLMQEFTPYGSIAARHGFKQLDVLDLRDTPLNDSDLQCFNAIENLKEIYLQSPEDDNNTETSLLSRSQSETNALLTNSTNQTDMEKPSTSSVSVQTTESSASNTNSLENVSYSESPSTSKNNVSDTDKIEDVKKKDDSFSNSTSLSINENTSSSSSSSSSSQSPNSSGILDNNITSSPISSSSAFGLSSNIVPLVSTNSPPRSRFLPRPDHIFYLDVRNRTSPNAVHFNIRDNNNFRYLRLPDQRQQNQQSPQPVIDQMMRHNLFWDIVNPLGRAAGIGGADRLFGEENGADYNLNLFSLSSPGRPPTRGSISDRGICCFGRTRQPVQQGVIWIRFNNRPSENRFERFSVRDYKLVTDISLQHLVQCSPHLIFLDVSGTSVTLGGLQRFKELKPECKVVAEHLLV